MIVEDVTELKILEEQLRQAQKMEAVGQLTGGIAHDFNNLLSVIQLNTELVRVAVENGSPVNPDDLLDIQRATHKASDMTLQLLGFSRKAELKFVPTELSATLRYLTTTLGRVLPETINIQCDASEGGHTVKTDVGAIEQILINLATNARDAMPDGGSLTIELERTRLDAEQQQLTPWVQPGPHVAVSVRDTGTGMDKQTLDRVFEPFFTTKTVGEGSGLGLAMVYGLMRQHGGFVDVCSELGLGTNVRLYFPLINEAAEETLVCRDDDPKGGTETILVVEDEDTLRRATKRVLEQFGYTVLAAEHGEAALEKYRQSEGKIHLIFSDTVMPVMGGPALYRFLEQDKNKPKFILTSGYTGREQSQKVDRIESVPFLQKPWTPADLLNCVRQSLDSNGAQPK